MAKELPRQGEHYLLADNVFRVVSVSRATDEIVLENIKDKARYVEQFAVFQHVYVRVWKIGDVASLLERHPRSIYRYESKGQIQKAKRYQAGGKHTVRFYTKEDIVSTHEMISQINQGRPRRDGRTTNNTLKSMGELLNTIKDRYNV